MRIFELKHQPAEALAGMVREFAGPEARIAVHRNTLVVNASPAELADIARLIDTYDRAQRMLRVTVEQGRVEQGQNRQLSTSGRIGDGSVAVGLGDRDRHSKNSVRIDAGSTRVAINAQDSTVREQRSASQFITVMEGLPARISIGRSVPFTGELRSYCRRHPGYVEAVVYQNVDTGFEVLPQVFGDMVQLEIRPYMAFLDERHPQQVVFQELSTQVRLPFGVWYDIGGQSGTQNDLTREILGMGASSTEIGNSVRLRVDPQ